MKHRSVSSLKKKKKKKSIVQLPQYVTSTSTREYYIYVRDHNACMYVHSVTYFSL